ncbi:MAG TPA: hypothetical protein PLJ21_00450 [Pseudobdellovibrionaceae bacterium]|nr:hypothetical protein [Pseudobdellovibrionaceae bacterium]
MKALTILSLILVISNLSFANIETNITTVSTYTDLSTDCILVSESTDLAPIDFSTKECKAFGGYTLRESGGDLRYGPELSFQGTAINLQRPSAFHSMGSQKIEWVYDLEKNKEGFGEIHFKALIYRLSVANIDSNGENTKDKSVLFVVRLAGEKSCLIGRVLTNKDARDLANSLKSPCSNENPL